MTDKQVGREERPAHLLDKARKGENLSDEINGMDPIDRRIHMQRMKDLADSQANDPKLPKVSIDLDERGNPKDIKVEFKSWTDKVKNGFNKDKDVYDTPAEQAAKGQDKKPQKDEPISSEEARRRANQAGDALRMLPPFDIAVDALRKNQSQK